MRKIPIFLAVTLSVSLINACSKSYNNGVDHTVGITNTARHWTGTAYGKADDTTISVWDDSTVVHTAKAYTRAADTSFAVLKHDTYAVTVFGVLLRYRETDSLKQTVKFDTVFSAHNNTAKTELVYYYAKDSMTFEYHKIKELNTYSGHYIEDHWALKTKKS
jgi:hypothetical protein